MIRLWHIVIYVGKFWIKIINVFGFQFQVSKSGDTSGAPPTPEENNHGFQLSPVKELHKEEDEDSVQVLIPIIVYIKGSLTKLPVISREILIWAKLGLYRNL